MWLVSIVSIVSIGIVVALCALGTFHNWYDDNLSQRIGMGCIVVGYGMLLAGSPVDGQPLAHVGLALFSVGTALKVRKHRRPPKPPAQQPMQIADP